MRSNEQLIQETLLAQLSEYQHQQLQELDIAKGIGKIAGGVGKAVGAVKGVGQGISQAYSGSRDATKQSTAKAIAGDNYKDTSAAQAAAGAAKAGGSAVMKGLQAVGRGVGAVGDLKSKVQGYDVATGTKKQQAAAAAGTTVAGMAADKRAAAKAADTTQAAQPAASGAAQPAASGAAQPAASGAAQPAASGAAQPAASAAPKVTATGGGAPGATQVPGQKPAAGAAPGSIVKSASGKDVIAGVDGKPTAIPANSPGAKKAIADIQAKAKAQGTTTTLINTPKGQDPAATGTEKPAAEPAKTAQDIAAKTGADAPTKKPDLKIAGQKVKPTDPLYDKLVAMIPAETRSSIDGLSDYDKGRLKKELSA